MAARVAPKGYSVLQIVLHWTIAALVIVQLLVNDDMQEAFRKRSDTGQFDGEVGAIAHITVGLTIFALAIFRLAIRFWRGVPEPHATNPPLINFFGHAAHVLLYAFLFAMPLTGAIAWFPKGSWTKIDDPAYAAQIQKAGSLVDRAARIPEYRKLQEYALDQCFTIPVCEQPRAFGWVSGAGAAFKGEHGEREQRVAIALRGCRFVPLRCLEVVTADAETIGVEFAEQRHRRGIVLLRAPGGLLEGGQEITALKSTIGDISVRVSRRRLAVGSRRRQGWRRGRPALRQRRRGQKRERQRQRGAPSAHSAASGSFRCGVRAARAGAGSAHIQSPAS